MNECVFRTQFGKKRSEGGIRIDGKAVPSFQVQQIGVRESHRMMAAHVDVEAYSTAEKTYNHQVFSELCVRSSRKWIEEFPRAFGEKPS
jgi:hypothetical protein